MSLWRYGWLLVLGIGTSVAATPRAHAQGSDSTLGPAAIDALAKAHLAMTALRTQLQAEMAEPKNKKPLLQVELRAKLQTETSRVLKEHGLTTEEFARLTRRVSTDDALRTVFEAALSRLAGAKSGA